MSYRGAATACPEPARCSPARTETTPSPRVKAGLGYRLSTSHKGPLQLPRQDRPAAGQQGEDPSALTSLHIDPTGLVLFNEALHLFRPRGWEQQRVEPRISLFLVDEFGQVFLGHVRFGLSMATSRRQEHRSISCRPGSRLRGPP